MPIIRVGKDILLIDGSYFIFYKYYSVLNWYRLQQYSTPIAEILNDHVFVDKYKKMFEKTIHDLAKKHSIEYQDILFVKDSPRQEVWRNSLYPEYKKDREKKKDTFNKDIVKLTYDTILPSIKQSYGIQVYSYPRLEADDLIGIIKGFIRTNCSSSSNIIIITNDNDYIQLYDEDTTIVNLKGKELKERIPVNHSVYLKYKIIAGDKSDCIPSIMRKLGPKTAEKLCQCNELLEKYLDKHPEARKQYALNESLIDMQQIPEDLKETVFKDLQVLPI